MILLELSIGDHGKRQNKFGILPLDRITIDIPSESSHDALAIRQAKPGSSFSARCKISIEQLIKVFRRNSGTGVFNFYLVGLRSFLQGDVNFCLGVGFKKIQRIHNQIEQDKNIHGFTDLEHKVFVSVEHDFFPFFPRFKTILINCLLCDDGSRCIDECALVYRLFPDLVKNHSDDL